MEQSAFTLNLYERIAPLRLDDETKKQVIDIVFWAMEEVAAMEIKAQCAPNVLELSGPAKSRFHFRAELAGSAPASG